MKAAKGGEPARICYIHAGTHKTGTTYLQTCLTVNENTLAEQGLYIPMAGRIHPHSGHHNLAWELNGDGRYLRANGTVADLQVELSSSSSSRACLSSEDFEYLYRNEEAMRSLARSLGRAGYGAKVIIYFRSQCDYAESLYAELLKHGLAIGFNEFFRAFIEDGEFCYKQRWHFASNYSKLLDSYAAVFGRHNLIVRRYRQGAPGEIAKDFLAQMFPEHTSISSKVHLPDQPLNRALTPRELLELLVRNNPESTSGPESELPRWLEVQPEFLPERFEPAGIADVLKACYRLRRGVWKTKSRYRVFVPVISKGRLARACWAAFGIGRYARGRKALKTVFCRFSGRGCARTAVVGE